MTFGGKADLHMGRHRERQVMEDYQFMIDNGESHENAIKRLGVSAEAFRKMRQTKQARETRAS